MSVMLLPIIVINSSFFPRNSLNDYLFFPDSLFFCAPLVLILLAYRIALPANHPAQLSVTATVRLSLTLLVTAISLLPLSQQVFALQSLHIFLLPAALVCFF